MHETVYFIDTFTSAAFSGNPTAVCFTSKEINSVRMLAIASEFNLPVTAFVHKINEEKLEYDIRYFTSTTEIPACGHATLAAARVLFEQNTMEAVFLHTTNNIKINAIWTDETVWLSYPVYTLIPYEPGDALIKSLGLSSYLCAGICEELETLFIELE